MRRLIWLILPLIGLLAACGVNPKKEASDWAKRFPLEIGAWESEGEHLEMLPESPSNYGTVIITYTGPDDLSAVVQVTTYATENAADIALAQARRDWELRGARFERERVQAEGYRGNESFDLATTPGGRLIYYQSKETILTISITALDPAAELPQDQIELLLQTIVAIVRNKD
jgi:hypothetical protein